jgi:RNA polymerase sigma-70 factor (ECF subfamily)
LCYSWDWREDPVSDRWSSEADLVAGLRAGDSDAFRHLVESLHAPLIRMARMYVHEALAEEVVQDTWLAVIRSAVGFEGRATLKTWVFRIMLNKVRTMAKRERKVVPYASVGPAVDATPSVPPDRLVHPDLGVGYWPQAPARWDTRPEEQLLSGETMTVVKGALAKMRDAQREVMTLRDIEGWTSEEVCEALGVSSVNQRVLLHRARASVRAALEEYFNE